MQIEIALLSLFASFIVIYDFNVASRFRVSGNERLKKLGKGKFLQCMPCFSFWTSIIWTYSTTQEIYLTILTAALTYLTAQILEK